MTRRRFYASPDAFEFDKDLVKVSAEEARHARYVLRLNTGDEVYVFDGEGREFRGVIKEFAHDGAALDLIGEVDPAQPESPLDLTLVLALLKHEKFDFVVQKATELGVTRIIPLESARADVHFKDAEDARRRLARWRRIALEATKQSGRARAPEISSPVDLISLKPAPDNLQIFFSERDGKSLSKAMNETPSPLKSVAAIVGPEGGWSDEEIELAEKNGWTVVTLGGRTLRAETAAISIVALLQHRFGDLN